MSTVRKSVDVDVPVDTAYNQCTQFESFPQFMDGVESITQQDDSHTHWVVKVGGVSREYDTEITEQTSDEVVAWRSTGGTPAATAAGWLSSHWGARPPG